MAMRIAQSRKWKFSEKTSSSREKYNGRNHGNRRSGRDVGSGDFGLDLFQSKRRLKENAAV
jgi:hypothetical protein